MHAPSIQKEGTARQGRYVARQDGIGAEGELTFTRLAADLVSADHTGVPDAMAGRGVGSALVAFMLEDARENGFRILPRCSFIAAYAARHPECASLFVTAPGENN